MDLKISNGFDWTEGVIFDHGSFRYKIHYWISYGEGSSNGLGVGEGSSYGYNYYGWGDGQGEGTGFSYGSSGWDGAGHGIAYGLSFVLGYGWCGRFSYGDTSDTLQNGEGYGSGNGRGSPNCSRAGLEVIE